MKQFSATRRFLQISSLIVCAVWSPNITANYLNDALNYLKNKGYEDIVKPTLVGIVTGAAPQVIEKYGSNMIPDKNLDKPAATACSVYYLVKKDSCTQLTFYYVGYIIARAAPSFVSNFSEKNNNNSSTN